MTPRILHLAYSGLGGVGQAVVTLARNTDPARFRSSVCFFGVEPVWREFPERLEQAGVPWSYLHLENSLGGGYRLLRHCCEQKPDILVAHGPTHARLLPLVRLLQRRTKCVAVVHGPSHVASGRAGLRWLPGLMAAHEVVCVGPHLARSLRSHFNVNATVIRNGLEIEPQPAASTPYRRHEQLLMNAMMFPLKDHATVLDAAAVLARKDLDFRLNLAGDGPLRAQLERRAAGLGLGGRVAFLGALNAAQVREQLAESGVFVYASHGEGGCPPLAIQEAMVAGLPVVATSVPGIQEALRTGENALLAPPGDPVAMADAIALLLRLPERSERLGRAAREWAVSHFRAAAAARRYERLFEALLDPGQGRHFAPAGPAHPPLDIWN